MAHSISGILGPTEVLRTYSECHGLHTPAPTYVPDLAFLPLSNVHLDKLFPDPGASDPAMTYLSESLKRTLAHLSSQGGVAWVETEYFGGIGSQAATAYRDGRCILEPSIGHPDSISEALQLLGVRKAPGDIDEFATAGLHHHRHNEEWIAAAAGANDESLHTPLALSNLPWMEVPDDAPAEQEVKPSPPGGFSLVACLLAAGINFAGCFLLAGMRFADGMGSFGTPSTPHFPLAAWLWSPLAMGTYAITGTPPDPASPEFVLISAISFGVFVGYLVGWIRRPIHA